MEKTLLEKIDSHTLLLKSCVMSSYFESTISDCSVASILYSLWYLVSQVIFLVNIVPVQCRVRQVPKLVGHTTNRVKGPPQLIKSARFSFLMK